MISNDLPIAERLLKNLLKSAPTDVTAVRMLAEVAVRVGRNEEAQSLLEYCLELVRLPVFLGRAIICGVSAWEPRNSPAQDQ